MSTTTDIASKHLGKTTSYEKTTDVDPSLLVAIPRALARDENSVKANGFAGVDIWHCYEFSTLLSTGLPAVGILKISVPAESEFIVESKSLKLYLNSYNFAKLVNREEDNRHWHLYAEKKIRVDLTEILGIAPFVCIQKASAHTVANRLLVEARSLYYEEEFSVLERYPDANWGSYEGLKNKTQQQILETGKFHSKKGRAISMFLIFCGAIVG